MELTVFLRVSWLCLLSLGCAAARPAGKGDYKYPYAGAGSSDPGSGPQGQGSPSGNQAPLVPAADAKKAPGPAGPAYPGPRPGGPGGPAFGPGGPAFGPGGPAFGPGGPAFGPGGPAFGPGGPVYNWLPVAPEFPHPVPEWQPPGLYLPAELYPVPGGVPGGVPVAYPAGGASERSPVPPSSFIVQSRNGFHRMREAASYSRYSPEFPQQPLFPFQAGADAANSPPLTGSTGGAKV
ncbi:uncharacterized protein V6R79_021467 [Siganus canaliculatus]